EDGGHQMLAESNDTHAIGRTVQPPTGGLSGPDPPSTSRSAPSGQRQRHHVRVAVAATVVGLATVAGVGIGHEAWPAQPSSTSNPAPPLSSFGSSGSFGGSSNGNGPDSGGSHSDIEGIAAGVAPALVDINCNFGYQSAQGAGTGIVLTSSGEIITNN